MLIAAREGLDPCPVRGAAGPLEGERRPGTGPGCGAAGGSGGGSSGGGKAGGIVISPFRLEELTNRLASLQQENKVLKIELETYKLKCKALQEENRDLRKASVTIVSAPRGRAAAPTPARPGRGSTRTRAAPGLPEVPGVPQGAHAPSRPAGLRRVGEREVSLRGHAGLSSPGVQARRGVREKAAGTTHSRSLFTPGEEAPPGQSWRLAAWPGEAGWDFFSTSVPEGCFQNLGSPALGKGEEAGACVGGLAWGAGVRSWAGRLAGIWTARAGSPGRGRERVAGNPGSGVFWPGSRGKGGCRS